MSNLVTIPAGQSIEEHGPKTLTKGSGLDLNFHFQAMAGTETSEFLRTGNSLHTLKHCAADCH